VSSSVILVTTTPLWVALLSPVVLKEKVSSRFYWGMAVAIIGGICIAISSPCRLSSVGLSCSGSVFERGSQTLWGMALALFGAWMASGYMLIGRKMRLKMDNLSYTTAVYTVSAIVLILVVIFRGEKILGYSPQTAIRSFRSKLLPRSFTGNGCFNGAIRRTNWFYHSGGYFFKRNTVDFRNHRRYFYSARYCDFGAARKQA
jgi:uncharacterized membrane protein